MPLNNVAVDPIRNVQGAVSTQRKQVVGGDCLCLSGTLNHKQLGQDCGRFEPEGKGPEHLRDGVFCGADEGEEEGGQEEVFDLEGVNCGVAGGLEVVRHEVEGVGRGRDEEDLHEGVVRGGGEGCE